MISVSKHTIVADERKRNDYTVTTYINVNEVYIKLYVFLPT